MKKILLVLTLAIAAALAWYLLSPLFFDTLVDEEFPIAPSGLSEDEQQEIAKIESLTPEQVDAMTEDERMEAKRFMEEQGNRMADTIADEPMDTSPKALFSGTFKDADSFHKGSGTATVYLLPDENSSLRLENFAVTNGPALSVYLVKSPDGNVDSGYLDLGKLKGNKGNQNYEIPPGIDLSQYRSVIIWCVPFKVTFATATLR